MADVRLSIPISEAAVRGLKLGDTVFLTGTFVTARDEAHIHALDALKAGHPVPFEFKDSAVFHCGPIAREVSKDRWEIVAAGPTTSTRMNSLEPDFLRKFRPRAIIGKGGMSKPTIHAMKEVGAVYLAITGGAAVVAAKGIERVAAVYWLEELGMPEALWVLEGKDFGPMTVGIDAHGNSIFDRVDAQVKENVGRIKKQLGIE